MSDAHGFEKENALLLAASHVEDGTGLPEGPFDWEYLERAAGQQGVTSLLYDWLQRRPDVVVDDPWKERLHDEYWHCHFRNRLLVAELQRVVRAAAEAGIAIMPLKGARLAVDYYPRPALRPLSDLDVLVRPDDVVALGRVLRALRYDDVEPPPSYVEDRWLSSESLERCWFATLEGVDALVECRTAPLELAVGRLTDLDRHSVDALRDHAEAVWARTASTAGDTSVGLRMSPEDLLLHVATHMSAKHADFRLIWLHDLARILMATPRLDWDYIGDTATRLRVAAPVTVALLAAARFVGAPISAEQVGRIRAGTARRSAVALERWDYRALCSHLASLPRRNMIRSGPAVWPIVAALSRMTGWAPRIRALRWVAFPSRSYLAPPGTEIRGRMDYVSAWLRRSRRRITGQAAGRPVRPRSP